MLLMLEKGIRGGMCHTIRPYTTHDKHMRDYDPAKNRHISMYWGMNNLHVWAMSQKVPVDTFQWK